MSKNNSENNAHSEPLGAIWVKEYERSTGHVSGHWKIPDGHRIDSVEVNNDGATPF